MMISARLVGFLLLLSNLIGSVDFIPSTRYIKNHIFNPISPRLSSGYDFLNNNIIAAIGGGYPLMEFNNVLQFGVHAGVTSLMVFEPNDFPISTIDYIVLIPADIRITKSEYVRFSYTHRSSHFSDEVKDAHKKRNKFSVDYLSLDFYSYDTKIVTYSAGLSFYIKTIPHQLPIFAYWAIEISIDKRGWAPFGSIFLRVDNEFEFTPSINIIAGTKFQGEHMSFKLIAEYYNGYSQSGQYYNLRENNLAIKFVM